MVVLNSMRKNSIQPKKTKKLLNESIVLEKMNLKKIDELPYIGPN